MPLRLERALKREIDVHGVTYTVTFSPLGVRLVRKGFRKGVAVSWRRLLALAAGEASGGVPGDTLPHALPHSAGDAAGGGASSERR